MTILSHYSTFVNTFFYFFLSFFRFGHLCEYTSPFSSVFSPFRSIIFADVRSLDTLTGVTTKAFPSRGRWRPASNASRATDEVSESRVKERQYVGICCGKFPQMGERGPSQTPRFLSPPTPYSPWLSATVSHHALR